MEKKDACIKLRTCAVMQYFDYYDVSEVAVIESRIKNLSFIKKYAFIIHDKDLLDNWEPKKKHFHIVLTFDNATTIGAVAKGLWVESQYVEKIRTTTKSAMLYLVHRNNPEKYQYEPKDVIANFDYIEYVDGCMPKQNRESIAERINDWEIKQYNLHNYISINEYARNRNFYNNCFIFRQEKMRTQDRNLHCIFISWKSWCWKTTLAKDIASKKGYACYISSGWKHPLDNYAWQECIILDDLRENTYEYNDLLKLTDNYTDSLVWCRFYNKSIAECKLLIITTVISIDKFANYWASWEDTSIQLLRRFQTYIVLDPYYIYFYHFKQQQNLFWDSSEDYYELITKANNYISEKFYKSSDNKYIVSLIDDLWIKPLSEI